MKDLQKGLRKEQSKTEGLMVSEGTMSTYPQITDMIYRATKPEATERLVDYHP